MADNLIPPQDDELDVEELEDVAGGLQAEEAADLNQCTNGSQCQCPR